MRKWFASLAVLGLAATAATAQTIPNAIANSLFQVSEDDNAAELAYKLFYPSAAGEAFNVDFNSDAAGMTVMGVAVELYISAGTGQIGTVAVCADNLALDASGRTPDLASPLASLTNPTGSPSAGGGFCSGFTTYDTPDVALGTGGVHGVVSFAVNDSNTWMCTDAWDSSGFNHTGARHSFWTTDSYATPSSYSFNKWNYMIRLSGPPATPGGGLFLVNGLTSGTMPGGGTISLQFWSSDGAAPTLYLMVLNAGGPLIAFLPVVLSTGNTNFVPNGIQQLGVITGTMPCSATGLTLTFGCFFSDNLDKKKNGKNKIKLSNFSSTTVTPSKICSPNVCFGIRDDGTMENGVFNPRIWYGFGSAAKTNDCASVHMGKASPLAPVVTNLTAVESATWDFCGTNPCWQQVGIYQSNLTVDPSGNTPNLGAPLTSIGGSSACYPGGAFTGSWGFPATVYDTPDILANTTTDYHTSFEFANNDSCLFVGLDGGAGWVGGTSDDLGDDCAPQIQGTSSVGSFSFYSLDGFATPAVDGTGGGIYPVYNLLERIDWN
jgi:hypothetical protein